MTERRSWMLIKLAEDDYSKLGVLIQGPRAEDEKVVALQDIVDLLGDNGLQQAGDFLIDEFGAP
jgi:hypothetical protein